MPVLLCATLSKSTSLRADRYCNAASAEAIPGDLSPVTSVGERLERCFDRVRDVWWSMVKDLTATQNGKLAHMPTCSTYASDFGQIAAWALLIKELANEPETTLVLCRDPWLFREVAPFCQVQTAPPALFYVQLGLFCRGYLARAKLIVNIVYCKLKTAKTRNAHKGATRVLVAYSHPQSRADGYDAYFGDLMLHDNELKRLIHTDGDPARALALSDDGRTASLHAWGKWAWLPAIFFTRWRIAQPEINLPLNWLIKRAVANESATASAATNRWQIQCMRTWVNTTTASVIVWPWENHPWERDVVQAAKNRGIKTIGYQHTVVGRHMYNQSPHANPDGIDGLPDEIITNGKAYRRDLISFGVPKDRLKIGGAYRQRTNTSTFYDPKGPIFIGLSNNPQFAEQMMVAVIKALDAGLGPFLVKDHPMCPFPVEPRPGIQITDKPMGSEGGISALIYCTGTIGLEGLLAGLPTFRFVPNGYVAMDILPNSIDAHHLDASNFAENLRNIPSCPDYDIDAIFSPVMPEIWRQSMQIN
jgi:hypothetical protein